MKSNDEGLTDDDQDSHGYVGRQTRAKLGELHRQDYRQHYLQHLDCLKAKAVVCCQQRSQK